jgi:hypothetical protein
MIVGIVHDEFGDGALGAKLGDETPIPSYR